MEARWQQPYASPASEPLTSAQTAILSAQPSNWYSFRSDLFLAPGSFLPGSSLLSQCLWQHGVKAVENHPLLAAVPQQSSQLTLAWSQAALPHSAKPQLNYQKGSRQLHWIFQAKHNIKPPITAANSHFSISFVSCHKFYILVTSCILFQGFFSILGTTYWD